MSLLSRPGELHIELDSDSGMGSFSCVEHPLPYPVCVDRLIKSDTMGDASYQIS